MEHQRAPRGASERPLRRHVLWRPHHRAPRIQPVALPALKQHLHVIGLQRDVVVQQQHQRRLDMLHPDVTLP